MKSAKPSSKFKPVALVAVGAWIAITGLLFLDVSYQKFWVGVGGGVLVVWLLSTFKRLHRQQSHLQTSLNQLADGTLSSGKSEGEGHQIPGQEVIYKVQNKLEEAASFISALEEESQIELTHLTTNEHLGQALVGAQTAFTTYRREEEKRRWSAEGLALFSDVFRENTDDIQMFSQEVIQQLVKYLKVNQGGLFFIDEEEEGEHEHLKLQACYAYDKKKYSEKKIRLGQGLVGQCALERKPIILTKVPKDYVDITSGLGKAPPRFVAIFPLLFQEKVKGVIELASFHRLEDYQIAFAEKVCENIASTLAIVRGSDHTQQMLRSSQQLAVELRDREEKMHMHLEELAVAQRKMEENQAELEGVFRAMDATLLVVYFDLKGSVIVANQNFADLLCFSPQSLKNRSGVLADAKQKRPTLWNDLRLGENVSGDFLLKTAQQKDKWINASLSAVKTPEGDVQKILLLGTDITKKKLVLEKLSLVANNTDNSVVITNKHGQIEYVNDGFVKLTGYSAEEAMWKRPGDILQGPNTDPDTVRRIGQMIRKGVPFYEEILNYKKTGESYWISLMINPVRNEEGEIERFVSIQADVTRIKKATLDYTYKLEAISKSNAVVEFDVQGEILEANPMFLEVSGYAKEDIIGQSYECLMSDGERDKPQTQMMWENLKEGTFFSGEFRIKSSDNKELWLNGTYNPIFDLEGELHRIIMFAQFTTHEKEKQQELTCTVKALNNAVLTLEMNGQGGLKKANHRFLKTFGYKRLEIARMNLQDLLVSPKELPQLSSIDDQPDHDLILKTSAGEEKSFRGIFTGVNDLGGKQTKIILALTETTNSKK